MVTISLAILTYNSGKYIPESVGNMLSYVNEVVVCIDSRTKDNTKQLLNEMNKINTNKIKYFDRIWNHNFSDAKNELIKRCTSDWIIIYDDDEKFCSNHAKLLTDYIRSLPANIGGLLIPSKIHYPDWSCNENNYLKNFYPNRHLVAMRNFPELRYNSIVHEGSVQSVVAKGYQIINYDAVNTHHHGWKGSREKYEAKKHYYCKALSELGNNWKMGDSVPANIKPWLEGWQYEG